jgi:meckelin
MKRNRFQNFFFVLQQSKGKKADPGSSDPDGSAFSPVLLFVYSKNFFLFLAIIQYLVYVVFYQRFVEDKLLNFIDLCSVSNISVLLLIDNRYGYYIHGRSPHGTTDVNMKDMLINLERESNRMSGTRGLEAKSDDQTFIIKIDGAFRAQYDLLIQTYRVN